MRGRILFARIGWMTFYKGAHEERPQGGGSYTKENIGSELFNFKRVKEYLYGFVNAGSGDTAINLRRLDVAAKGKAELDNVTVVFVAKHPQEGGQRVVGWYKDATVYAKKRRHPLKVDYKKKIDSCVRAPASRACLVPTPARKQDVPFAKGGTGGMGESNVRYYDEHGGRKGWMGRVLEYVDNYSGPNLLEDEDAEAEQIEDAQIVIETSAGFETNPKIRRAVEEYAMRCAERHFTKLGFSVRRLGKPYDLLCKKNSVTKFVEVKGTQTAGTAVALTRNEVDFLKKNASSAILFVVHSVRLKKGKKPTAYGGEQKLVEPWDPSCGVLKPITYFLHFH